MWDFIQFDVISEKERHEIRIIVTNYLIFEIKMAKM